MSDNTFPCGECDRVFTTSSHLIRHMHIHTGAKPHKCPHCDKTTSRKDNLTAHIKSVHDNPHPRRRRSNRSGTPVNDPSAPFSSSSSASVPQHFSPPERFRSPSSDYSAFSPGSSPETMMSPLPPTSDPYAAPYYGAYPPGTTGLENQFDRFALQSPQHPSRPGSANPYYPAGVPMSPPGPPGSPEAMLLQHTPRMHRCSHLSQPGPPPTGTAGPSTYPGPYTPYAAASRSPYYPQYASNASTSSPSSGSASDSPSPTYSDFPSPPWALN